MLSRKVKLILIGLLLFAIVGCTPDVPESKDAIVSDCMNLSLQDTADCLVENVKTFYIYNLTKDDDSTSWERISSNGGNCEDWTYFYMDLGTRLGFEVSMAEITMYEGKSHVFAIIGDETGYCNLDQLEYKCYEYD